MDGNNKQLLAFMWRSRKCKYIFKNPFVIESIFIILQPLCQLNIHKYNTFKKIRLKVGMRLVRYECCY